jgi:hypothetical protein
MFVVLDIALLAERCDLLGCPSFVPTIKDCLMNGGVRLGTSNGHGMICQATAAITAAVIF